MPIEYFCAGADPAIQQEAVDMLCRCFDEWVEFKNIYGRCFPFYEHSFIARENGTGRLAGHVGVMPFDVSDGQGGIWRMAGIASVGVDPDFRGLGIAQQLCENAAQWAQSQHFHAMPLYTSVNPVYRKCHWQDLKASSQVMHGNADCSGLNGYQWKKSSELTDMEKDAIVGFYQALPPLAGRVMRTLGDNKYHSWEWIFRNPAASFIVKPSGYAAAVEGVIAEAAGDIIYELSRLGLTQALLAADDPAAQALLKANWHFAEQTVTAAPACWHGESVMLRNWAIDLPESGIFFALLDKF